MPETRFPLVARARPCRSARVSVWQSGPWGEVTFLPSYTWQSHIYFDNDNQEFDGVRQDSAGRVVKQVRNTRGASGPSTSAGRRAPMASGAPGGGGGGEGLGQPLPRGTPHRPTSAFHHEVGGGGGPPALPLARAPRLWVGVNF